MRSGVDPAVPARIGRRRAARTCPDRHQKPCQVRRSNPKPRQVEDQVRGLARLREVEAPPLLAALAGFAAREPALPAFFVPEAILALDDFPSLVDFPPGARRPPRPPSSCAISRSARCQCSSCLPWGRPSRSQISWARCSVRRSRSADLIRLSSLRATPSSPCDCRLRSRNSKLSRRFHSTFNSVRARLPARCAGP